MCVTEENKHDTAVHVPSHILTRTSSARAIIFNA